MSSGKVALVTGSGGMRGVGRATALKLARNGVDLVLTDAKLAPQDRPPAELEAGWHSIDSVADEVRALGVRCQPIYCDLGRREQIEELVQQTVAQFGHIDILVNNARAIVGRDLVSVTELSEEVWNHFLKINATAVFLLIKLAGREMIRRGKGGRIISVGSNTSRQGKARMAAYSASKFTVVGLTQASALDLAPYGITVNVVCPGPINTGRLSYWEQSQAKEKGMSLADFRATVVEQGVRITPLGRIAEPEDVANLIAFLASDEASFITGQAYNVNGGLLFH